MFFYHVKSHFRCLLTHQKSSYFLNYAKDMQWRIYVPKIKEVTTKAYFCRSCRKNELILFTYLVINNLAAIKFFIIRISWRFFWYWFIFDIHKIDGYARKCIQISFHVAIKILNRVQVLELHFGTSLITIGGICHGIIYYNKIIGKVFTIKFL